MEQSLRSAIYYLPSPNRSKYDIITELIYDGTRESFGRMINNFRSNIQIRNLFGNKENICYQISDNLYTYYDVLLLNQLDTILIVTRYDEAIRVRKDPTNPTDPTNQTNQTNQKDPTMVGIIKIDSVIAELGSGTNGFNWYKYPLILGGILGLFLITLKISEDGLNFDKHFDNMFKSD